MAAALLRGGSGLCVRCIHRELCRVVWRPQAALFSSKPSDRKQPRRTHIKKAKPQPAIDIAKLLEQLFSQQRPGTAPPAGKARPVKASPVPTKPLSTSTSNVPPLSKTEPAASVFAAASSSKHLDGVREKTTSTFNAASASPVNPKTSYSSETPQQSPLDSADGVSNVTVPPTSTTPASLGPQAAAVETIETSLETATAQPLSAAKVEISIETTAESPVEPFISPVETLHGRAAVAEDPVLPIVEEVQTKGTDSGVATAEEESLIETLETSAAVVEGPVEPTVDVTVDIAAETKSSEVAAVKEEPLIETPVEANTSPLETHESKAAVADFPVESTVDATTDAPAQAVETNKTDSGPVKVEPLVETAVGPSVEASTSPLETPENRDAVAGGSVETTIETKAEEAAQTVETTTTDSGPVKVETAVETAVEPSVEASVSPLASLENRDAVAEGSVETKVDTTAQEVQTNSSDSGVVNISSGIKEEPLIETKLESETVETSTSPPESSTAVSEAPDSLSHTALIQNAQEFAPLPLKNESTVESSSVNVPVEEKMTLEFITLHGVEVQVGSLKADELLQTKSSLDEQIEKQLQELLVQTEPGAEYKAAAETENSSEDESEILTKALSNWDSLSEDLQELEGESGMLVNDLLCHVTAVLSKTPAAVETRLDSEESLRLEEKGSEAEAMTLESITLSNVKAEVEGLESEVLLETRKALYKEAEVLAEEEKMEVETTTEDVALLEDAAEAELLAVDSISEATDAIEAETSVLLEAMFGSEQGPRQPLDTLPVKQRDEVIDQEAEKESGEQEGSVLEAMTLESVTLAEVEASLGSLENESLSETTDYLETEAEILAGETRTKVEVEDEVVSEEKAEELKIESLFLPEDDALSELQTDALMEELLFSVPGHVTREREGPIGQEANILNAAVATGSVHDDSADAPALEEVQLEQEVEEEGAQTEALGNEYDLDPVQRLFLEKIREYNTMRGLNGGPLEAEPDYEKHLSQETAKLQRLYGGGDLNSFPEFTFTEPEMDQDSK
ncbi:uncharacterized protein [Pagrus major]|uniref:uncharacterized protein n=1 Tax=Pagrus major TaxID=143350 RepID=UPI003CC857F3